MRYNSGDKVVCILSFEGRLTRGKIYTVEQMGDGLDVAAHSGDDVVRIVMCDKGHGSVRFPVIKYFEPYVEPVRLDEDLFTL
jgi:hypothetical protein